MINEAFFITLSLYLVIPAIALFLMVWDIRDKRLTAGKEGPRGFEILPPEQGSAHHH